MKNNTNRNDLIVRVTCNSRHGLDHLVKSFYAGGYQLIQSRPRPKYYILGPVINELVFIFFPSDDVIKGWITKAIIEERYEDIVLWQNVLEEKKRCKV